MKNNPLIYGVLFLSILCACGRYPKDVDKALKQAGDNKQELVNVLEYYREKDKLKYEAACFLISNMPYHQSTIQLEISPAYQRYFAKVDSICNADSTALGNDSLKHSLAVEFDSILVPEELETKSDIQFVKADFLIDNIEQAFDSWYNSPLSKKLSFDDFKEWILPYRSVDEALVDNKRLLRTFMLNKLSKKKMDVIYNPIECYKNYVWLQKGMNKYITSKQHIGSYDLFIPAFLMDCHNLAARTCNYFRACGIPVVCEFTPQWPERDAGHYWCASPDTNDILQPYTPPFNNLREDWELSLKVAGKIYQRTFGIQKNTPYFLKQEQELVPMYFDVPTIKDVTERYRSCTILTLPIRIDSPNKLAYLSFFNSEKEFTPVAWGKINKRNHTVTFENIPFDELFFPTYITGDGEIHCFDSPFVLRQVNGEVVMQEVLCDTAHPTNMHLLRKYPSKKHLTEYRKTLKGAYLLGANQWLGPYDTLLTIKAVPEPFWQEYCFENTNKYRFYRFQANKQPMDIAEIEFIGRRDAKHKYDLSTPLPIFSVSDERNESDEYVRVLGEPMKTGTWYFYFFDRNPETYAKWGFLGIDYKTPVCISRIRLLPRTAINIIVPGCHYQLLYFKNGRWVEHSIVISEYNYLDFESVPKGALYWLKNLDKGKEELPFLYKDGKQLFINQFAQ